MFMGCMVSFGPMTSLLQQTGLLQRLEQTKVIMTEPKASAKVDFDQLLADFYDVIRHCEQCTSCSHIMSQLLVIVICHYCV